eukprot:CAMPEP_0184485466 /NCGR_PEP_ID=MMETSP0113_2-20130426/7069_1 /TAXON_ID=91329 /ORGANISM="Norrisiella sphaerica, Strain BC52" /LENGTH=594 /DNA_ID=CAMNT_0026866923 /DNA_START=160 /DNA_END=1944 /DNA_ORIENTATION=+
MIDMSREAGETKGILGSASASQTPSSKLSPNLCHDSDPAKLISNPLKGKSGKKTTIRPGTFETHARVQRTEEPQKHGTETEVRTTADTHLIEIQNPSLQLVEQAVTTPIIRIRVEPVLDEKTEPERKKKLSRKKSFSKKGSSRKTKKTSNKNGKGATESPKAGSTRRRSSRKNRSLPGPMRKPSAPLLLQDEDQDQDQDPEPPQMKGSKSSQTPASRPLECKQNAILQKASGILAIILGGLIFSAASACIKIGNSVSAMQYLLIRCFVGAIITGVTIKRSNGRILGSDAARLWIVLRGVAGSMSAILLFLSYIMLPLGNAVSLLATGTMWAMIVNFVFMREPLTWVHMGAFVLSIIGCFFVVRPSFIFGTSKGGEDPIGYVVALLGAFFSGLQYYPMRKAVAQQECSLQLLFSFCTFSAVFSVMAAYTIPGQSLSLPVKPVEWICIGVVTTAGYVVQSSLIYASKYIEGGVVSLVASSDVIWAFIWQVFFFGSETHWFAYLGATLIVSSVFVVGMHKLYVDLPARRGIQLENPSSPEVFKPGSGKGLHPTFESARPERSRTREILTGVVPNITLNPALFAQVDARSQRDNSVWS